MAYYQDTTPYGNDAWLANNAGLAVADIDRFLMENNYAASEGMVWDYAGYDNAGGEPLMRYGSSGGSSFNSVPSPEYTYAYESPTATIDPNLIQNCDTEPLYSPMAGQSPPVRTTTRQRHSSTASISCDLCGATFKRRADLKRHKDHIHDSSNLVPIYCDYSKCNRSAEPFRRKDHFRDHLREYHREDVEPRGVQVGKEWYANRNTSSGWWRCVRCLERIRIERHGFSCPDCGGSAGKRRQEARRRH